MVDSSSLPHVVVIDDERSILNLLEATLAASYQVSSFVNPIEALDALHALEERPALILCDVMMPQMDGFAVHAQLREHPRFVSVPFIYLTALDARESIRKGMHLGADDYITKPFVPETLRQTIAQRLARIQNLQQNTQADNHITIESLGGFRVSLADKRVHWSVKKAAVAFLYFLEHPEPVALDKIKRDLWRDEVADNTLHVLHLRLRKVIHDFAELVVENREAKLLMQYPVQWDMQSFREVTEQAMRDEELETVERAITIYKGEFMPSFDVPWAEDQRHQLESMYMELLELSIDLAPEARRTLAETRLARYLDS